MEHRFFLRIILSFIVFTCLGLFASTLFASPFCPLEWQQEVMWGDFKGHRKHLHWARDKNWDFIDDAFNDLKSGEKTNVIVELNGCQGDIDLEAYFSYFGNVVYIGVSVGFVLIEDVPQEKLKELAACGIVAGLEYPEVFELSTDTSTRAIRKHASNTYSLETFEDEFPRIKGKGVNIAIVDSGVDDEVHAAFAGRFIAGYNALTEKPENPDDDAQLPYITTGPDGICDTVAELSDEQIVVDVPCVAPGPDNELDTDPVDDDHIYVLKANEGFLEIIKTGPDGECDSDAANDDYQLIPHGGRPENAGYIGPGPDGTLETIPSNNDTLEVGYHGTHVAGIALGNGVGPGCRKADDGSAPNNCAGVAPEAGLIDVKVMNNKGGNEFGTVEKALDWIFLDGRADVVNISIGEIASSDGTDVTSALINALVANDITVVVAAGNYVKTGFGKEAAASHAITVGSANDQGTVNRNDDQFSYFSNFGPRRDFNPDDPTIGMLKPDITAPGSNICSAQGEEGNTVDSYHFLTGTSMAAPHVAGAAALIIQLIPDITPGALKDLLKRTAYQTPQYLHELASYPFDPILDDHPRYSIHWGYGLLDIYEAAKAIASTDMSFTDCSEEHPDYPTCRRCLLKSSDHSFANSVDIELETDPPVKGEENKITIHVENRGPETAYDVVVSVGVREVGVGLKEFYDVGSRKIISLPPERKTKVEIPWIPSYEDHQCIQATIDYGLDTDFTNNLTQRNINPVEASSPATAHFLVENPLNQNAIILLSLELDDDAQKYLKDVVVTNVPIGENFYMSPGDCPIMAQIDFLPNSDLPVGTKAKVTVTGKAISKDFPRGIELSGVTFNYEVVKKSVSYNVPKDYPTIQKAIYAADSGDTIYVSAGTYSENISMKTGINLIGSGADVTIIDGGGDGRVVEFLNNDNVSIEGFTIKNGIEGIFGYNSSNIKIKNNVIIYNKLYGIFISDGCSANIANNNIVSNGHAGFFIHNQAISATLKNNIIVKNRNYGVGCDNLQKNIRLFYNNVWNNKYNYSGCSAGASDISVDPLFINPAHYDYHLQAVSPCIDAGYPMDPIPEGGGRRIDIGAFEYTKTVSPKITSGPEIIHISDTSVKIVWHTDKETDSLIKYGSSTSRFTKSETDLVFDTSHSIILTNLFPSTAYNFFVESSGADGIKVASKTQYFTTMPEADNEDPVVQLIVPEECSGIVEVRAIATDNVGIKKVEFYIDDQYRHTDYSNDFGWSFNTRSMSNGQYSIAAQAYDLSGRYGYIQTLVNVNNQLEDNTAPYISFTRFEPTDLVTNELDLVVTARDPDSGIHYIRIYIDSEVKYTNVEAVFTMTEYLDAHFTWHVTAADNGTHEIRAIAYNKCGLSNTIRRTVEVLYTEPPRPNIEITRTQVERIGNASYRVELKVENIGDASAKDIFIKDYNKGFQVHSWEVHGITLSTPYSYDPETNYSSVELYLSFLEPGEENFLYYYLVPILPGYNPNNSEYIIGSSTEVTYTGSDETPYNIMVNTPAVYVKEPGGAEVQLTMNYILDSIGNCDYLVVTHPERLFMNNEADDVNELLHWLARFSSRKNAVLGYLDADPTNELLIRSQLSNAITPFYSPLILGAWNRVLNGGGHEWSLNGYMLIVGETEIVPAFPETYVTDGTGQTLIPLSDHPYADISGDGAPELRVGRIIGNTANDLKTAIINSLGVQENWTGYEFDRSNALLVSGTGNRYPELVANVEYTKNILLNDGFDVDALHWKDYVIMDSFSIDYQAHDGFALGDLGGDEEMEIVIADRSTDKIYIYNPDGALLRQFDRDFEEGDGFAVGNVIGDYKAEILVADRNDRIDIYRYYDLGGGTWGWGYQEGFDVDFEYFDGFAVGDVLGDELDEILIADRSEHMIKIYDISGCLLDSFICDYQLHDGFAVGDIIAGGKEEIVVAWQGNGYIYVFNSNGDILDDIECDFESGDQLAICAYYTSIEYILVMDKSENKVQFNCSLPSPIDFELDAFDALAVGDLVPGGGDEVVIADRSADEVYYYNYNYWERMRNAFTSLIADKDVIAWYGHGSQSCWCPAIRSNHAADLDFGDSRPFIYAMSCSTGDYSGDSIAEAFFKSGAAVYIGSTELSPFIVNELGGLKFFEDYWHFGIDIGEAFTNMERDLCAIINLSNIQYNSWTWEYNIYGDPKYGCGMDWCARKKLGAYTASTGTSASTPPPAFLEVEVPDYTVTSIDGVDYVNIPGGFWLLEIGRHRIPIYLTRIDYPEGYKVQDVQLASRTGLRTDTGLHLPINKDWDSPSMSDNSIYAETIEWYPEKEFAWNITEKVDGTTTLNILMYPFYYNQLTTDVMFYKNYEFNIDFIHSNVEIKHAYTERDEYIQGEIAAIKVGFENMSDNIKDVILSGEVESYVTRSHRDGLKLQTLDLKPGEASATLSLDTTNLSGGYYVVKVIAKDFSGTILDTTRIRVGVKAITTIDMELNQGWNMISLPCICSSNAVVDLFPNAEVVYGYKRGSGYVRIKDTESMEIGKGYWILINEAEDYELVGDPFDLYTQVITQSGWEMIGACTSLSQASTEGCDINVIYRYEKGSGYIRVPDTKTLYPGKGYWILLNNVNGECELTVNSVK